MQGHLRRGYEDFWVIPNDEIERFDKVMRLWREYSWHDSNHWWDIADLLKEYDKYRIDVSELNNADLYVTSTCE